MIAKTGSRTLLAIVLIAGCSQPPPPAPLPSPRLQQVARLYLWYAANHQQRGPTDRETFAAYIKSLDAGTQGTLRIDTTNPDELLTSPRDHQPYKIAYGLSLNTPYRRPPLVAYEQVGADGTRHAVFLSGQFREVPQAEMAKLLGGR